MIAEADIIESTTTEINTYKINVISANEMACVIKKSFSNSNRLAIIECFEQYHKSLKNAHPEGITY